MYTASYSFTIKLASLHHQQAHILSRSLSTSRPTQQCALTVTTRVMCTSFVNHSYACTLLLYAHELSLISQRIVALLVTVFSLSDRLRSSACGSPCNSAVTALTSAATATTISSSKSSGEGSVGPTDSSKTSSDPNSINYRCVFDRLHVSTYCTARHTAQQRIIHV
jgi:prophage DNA circulation protein